jgi:transcriptional regulator with XRE-family HTH domain
MDREKGTFGEVIRERRRQRELTQREVARQADTSAPYIGHLESGKRHPSDEIVKRLADILGFDRRELFFLANPHAEALLHSQPKSESAPAWERFKSDENLLHAQAITGQEMEMLERVALMGDVRSPRDFLYILNTVRQALAAE